MDTIYVQTVRLMLDAVPHLFTGKNFALKGGTAINLFVEEMPRLSVDLDLVTAVNVESQVASRGKRDV